MRFWLLHCKLSVSTCNKAYIFQTTVISEKHVYTGWAWKKPNAIFVDISAVRANFCMTFYTAVKQWNKFLINKSRFVEMYLKMTKYAFSRQPPFLSVLSVVFSGSLLALKRAWLLVMRWRCRLRDGQSNCTTTGSQALGEVRHRLVDVPVAALPRRSAGQPLAVVLGFSWCLWYFSSMMPQTW